MEVVTPLKSNRADDGSASKTNITPDKVDAHGERGAIDNKNYDTKVDHADDAKQFDVESGHGLNDFWKSESDHANQVGDVTHGSNELVSEFSSPSITGGCPFTHNEVIQYVHAFRACLAQAENQFGASGGEYVYAEDLKLELGHMGLTVGQLTTRYGGKSPWRIDKLEQVLAKYVAELSADPNILHGICRADSDVAELNKHF